GEPVQVILGPKTGLPIPAHAEIAFEGFIHPNDRIDEGPLGEWTGYYAGGLKKEPAIRVETMMYRDDPILLGAIPGIPPDDDSFYRGSYRSGAVCTRCDPREGLEILRGCWSSALDPMAYGAGDPRNARVVIDACKPFGRRATFPREVRASAEVEELVRRKFGAFLPK